METKEEYFRDYNKEYYAKNKAYYQEYYKKYYFNNKQKIKNYLQNWQKLNEKQDATDIVSITKGLKTFRFE